MSNNKNNDIYNELKENKNRLFQFIFTIIDNIKRFGTNDSHFSDYNKETKEKLFDEILKGAHIVIKQNKSQGVRQGGKYRSINSIFSRQYNDDKIITTIDSQKENDYIKKLYLNIVKFIINGGDNLIYQFK